MILFMGATTPRQRTIGGLPSYSLTVPGTFTGALYFGAGLRDESPRTAGISHLITRIVQRRVASTVIPHDCATSDDNIVLWARGRESAVAGFLEHAADAVASLASVSEREISDAKAVMAAELGPLAPGYSGGGHLLVRYGARDLGLTDFGAPAFRSIDAESIRAFAAQWLHAGNAALSFSGEPPKALNLSLEGRPPPTRRKGDTGRGNGWEYGFAGAVECSIPLRSSQRSAVAIAGACLSHAIHNAVYGELSAVRDVEMDVAVIDRTTNLALYRVTPEPARALEVARRILNIIRGVARDGPDERALAQVSADLETQMGDPTWLHNSLTQVAVSALRLGSQPADVLIAGTDGVTAEIVRDLVRDGLRDLLITIDAGDDSEVIRRELDLVHLSRPAPAFSAMDHVRRFRYRRSNDVESAAVKGSRRDSWLFLDSLRLTYIQGTVVTEFMLDDVVLAGVSADKSGWTLIGHDGVALSIETTQLVGGGGALIRKLDQLIPASKRYALSP